MVIWITGVSGAGKTTIANKLIKKYKKLLPNLINLDGDAVRELYGDNLGYTEQDRVLQIKRLQSICLLLEKQGQVVIASALYSSPALMDWNRENFSDYYEIYLNVSMDLVKKRDPKGIYNRYKMGKEKNIVGIDIPWIDPQKSDLVIEVDEGKSILYVTNLITDNIPLFRNIESDYSKNKYKY